MLDSDNVYEFKIVTSGAVVVNYSQVDEQR